ncbi:MAG: DUF4150 domain-containing protein [Polyangiaceae bacterium]|nr:DUF4150 domain-containing protein [Polyangiaceae bacterium]
MAVTINVNNLTLCHKDSGGISIATLPDVCKTPPNGVPIPYPNIAYARDLAKGTQTVVADGGNMCANYGSEFSKSTGDEAGSIGGVKSGTFIKEATWLTFSFNVRIEGKAACRLTDKMYHNHQNTVNASGLIQRVLATQKLLQKMLCDCDKEVQPTKDDNCLTLGTKKHDCMEKKKAEHNRLGKKPKLDGERGYNKKTGKPSFRSRRDLFERFRKLKELRKKIDTAKTALKATKAGAKVVKLIYTSQLRSRDGC